MKKKNAKKKIQNSVTIKKMDDENVFDLNYVHVLMILGTCFTTFFIIVLHRECDILHRFTV